MTKLKTAEEVATETWAIIYESLIKDKVKFPNNFDGIGAAYGGYARIIETVTQDRQDIHTSLVAAVEDYFKSLVAIPNPPATKDNLLTIINSIFKE